MNIRKKQTFILVIIGSLVVMGEIYFFYSKGYINIWKKEGEKTEERIYSEEEVRLYDHYMKEATPFILAGDNGDKKAYYKAIELYEKAAAVGNNNVWVPFLNIGNIYQKLADYQKAEEAYNKALEISKFGSDEIYFQKIDLYRYYLKKPNEEIDRLYEEAISKVVQNSNLILRYATFLRDSGQYEKALIYYEALVKNYPDNQAYKDELKFIKDKIQK